MAKEEREDPKTIDEDVEGHKVTVRNADDGDDVEGHAHTNVRGATDDDDDDVEAHGHSTTR